MMNYKNMKDIITYLELPFIATTTIGGLKGDTQEEGKYSAYILLSANSELIPITVTSYPKISKENIQMIIGMDIIKLGIFTIKPKDKNVVMIWEFIPEENNNLK